MYADATKLRAEGDKLYAEGDKMYAEGTKLRAESDKLWAEAVIAEYGPQATMIWRNGTCTLGNGEVYGANT